ncbi:MAG: tetratricopeptide repeat protein [Kiritimatiellae bacterium]|nr:tetratricopeptide repeat protein [Kiritimatiellia bacterium]MDD5519664.1 tetratricopeptide repeat protein [Kiritimatiellia bacterium]
MTTIKFWLSSILASVAGLALADFDADMRVAGTLCKDKKHEEAIQAYVRLGEGCSEPEQRFKAYRDAAVCTQQHLGNVPRALKLAGQINVEPYVKACRVTVYQWSPSNVVAEVGKENLTEWPEDLAAIGFAIRATAYYNLKNGTEAARDFLRAFQFAKSYDKWAALLHLGDTYWKLLDDERLAEACYRKCVADFGGGWPGLQARVNLADLLLSQKRYDAALQCLKGDKHGGYWQVALLYMEAKVCAEKGKKMEAITSLEAALKTVGINQYQQKDCEKMLSELKSGSPQQPSPSVK